GVLGWGGLAGRQPDRAGVGCVRREGGPEQVAGPYASARQRAVGVTRKTAKADRDPRAAGASRRAGPPGLSGAERPVRSRPTHGTYRCSWALNSVSWTTSEGSILRRRRASRRRYTWPPSPTRRTTSSGW